MSEREKVKKSKKKIDQRYQVYKLRSDLELCDNMKKMLKNNADNRKKTLNNNMDNEKKRLMNTP